MLRFVGVLALLAAVIAGGTVGYHLIEGWSLSESLYMTFITTTTVGFGEVRPLSQSGRTFTIIVIVLSIATVGYSVSTIINFIFEGKIITALKERRMARNIARMKGHFIICGYGRVGRAVAAEFNEEGVDFVVIDRDPQQTESAFEEEVPHIVGDASDDEVLRAANIKQAAGLVSAFPDDESNVFIVLSARQLNPSLTIVSQAKDDRSTNKLLKAGADRVISTAKMAGRRMAAIATRPAVTEFLEVVMRSGEGEMRIEEIKIDAGSPLKGKTLRETGIGEHTGALVIGITRSRGATSMNPTENARLSSMVLNEGDVLIALGSGEQLDRLRSFVNKGKSS